MAGQQTRLDDILESIQQCEEFNEILVLMVLKFSEAPPELLTATNDVSRAKDIAIKFLNQLRNRELGFHSTKPFYCEVCTIDLPK